jgi:large subunit ribosomal protein L28
MKSYYSHLLKKSLCIEMTTFVMRWIDKAGGFDAYIYHTPDRKLASKFGSDLKRRMMEAVATDPELKPPPRVRRVHAPPKRWTLGPPPSRKRPRPPFILPKDDTTDLP